MRVHALVTFGFLVAVSAPASAQQWLQVTPNCPTSSSGLFTVGGQYLDANNGVLPNSWSMLMRWQGNLVNPVNYNGGMWTGLQVPDPASSWQAGYQPENPSFASPLTQIHGCDTAMILNSYFAPHQPILGGGWNDMFGYSWGPNAPRAFSAFTGVTFQPADLVLQSDIAVPAWAGAIRDPALHLVSDPSTVGSAQFDFFVYLQDTLHPNLHPIALITGLFAPGWTGCASENGYANVGYDYASGVWFASHGVCKTDVSTVGYTAGFTTGSTFSALTFYRIHYTPANLTALINRIKSMQCTPNVNNSCNCATPGVQCPNNQYSTDPNDYVVQYAGVIAETALCGPTGCGTTQTDREIAVATRATGFSVYHYVGPAVGGKPGVILPPNPGNPGGPPTETE